MSLVLAQKIGSLFLIIAMGFALVRSGAMKADQSRGLSIASLYVISPCMIISAFQVQMTQEVMQGFLLALLASVICQVGFITLAEVIDRVAGLDPVEKASVVYPNCGNLIIPLVLMTFGQDMVIYCTAYILVQAIFLWSHGKMLMQGAPSIELKPMLLGVNMISIYIGLFLFLAGIQLPDVVDQAVSSVGSMIGPISMLITGMILGGMDFRRMRAFKRLPIPVLLRMIVFPLLIVAIFKFAPLASLAPNGQAVLMISLLAAAGPSASTINQMAQLYLRNAEYASTINVVTILVCIVTIPLMVFLFEM